MIEDPIAKQCHFCDFGSGHRGMDRCAKCDGTGSLLWAREKFFPNTKTGYDNAIDELNPKSVMIEPKLLSADELNNVLNKIENDWESLPDVLDLRSHIAAQSAEIAKLREALRARCLTQNRINEIECDVCECWWDVGQPEHHAPGCLAAPGGKKE